VRFIIAETVLSTGDYERRLNFPYLQTEDPEQYSALVEALGGDDMEVQDSGGIREIITWNKKRQK
jgi:hypothetical protein